MAKIIGRGRYATETYPETALGGGAPITEACRTGIDTIVTAQTFTDTVGVFVQLSRNGVDPVQVVVPDVNPGDVVEVTWNASAVGIVALVDLYLIVAVSSVNNPVFPDDFVYVANSSGGTVVTDSVNQIDSASGRAAYAFDGEGVATLTFQLLYRSDASFNIGGTHTPFNDATYKGTAATLKVNVCPADSFVQDPPGVAEEPIGGGG